MSAPAYTASGLSFLRSLVPLPEPVGNLACQAMTQRTREHDDLSAMMALVSDEIGEHVGNIQRQVAPDVGLRWRDLTSGGDAQLEECFDPFGALFECCQQLLARYLAAVDRSGNGEAVFPAERLDPRATRVVQVTGDHAYRAPRCAWHVGVPERAGQVLYEIRRDAAVGPPRRQNCCTWIVPSSHHDTRSQSCLKN